MYLKKNKQKPYKKEKLRITPLSSFVKKFPPDPFFIPSFYTIQQNRFFLLSLQLRKILFEKKTCSTSKLATGFFCKTQNHYQKLYFLACKKFNSFVFLNNTHKQMFHVFCQDYFFFQYFDLNDKRSVRFLLNSSISISQKSPPFESFFKLPLIQKTSDSLKHLDSLEKPSFYNLVFLNNYWLQKNWHTTIKTNTGKYWIQNHERLKNKPIFQLTLTSNPSRISEKTVELDSFLKRQWVLETSFFSSFSKKIEKKSILNDFYVVLFEFHKKYYLTTNYSYNKFIRNSEKNNFKLDVFQFLNLLFVMPKYLSLNFLQKNERLLKPFNESKFLFFKVKQILKKYQVFYLKQFFFSNFSLSFFHYNYLDFLDYSYCSSFNQIPPEFFKWVKKDFSNKLDIISIHLNSSFFRNPKNTQNVQKEFFLTNSEENLKTFVITKSFFFFKIVQLKTFQGIFLQKNYPNLNKVKFSKPSKLTLFDFFSKTQPVAKRQAFIELEMFLFCLIKKGFVFQVYSKYQPSRFLKRMFNQNNNPSCLYFLLKEKVSLFLRLNILNGVLLEKENKSVMSETLIIKDNYTINFIIANDIEQKKLYLFLTSLNKWAQQTYSRFAPIILINQNTMGDYLKPIKSQQINKAKITPTFENSKNFHPINFYLKNYFIILVSPNIYYMMPPKYSLFEHIHLVKKIIKLSAGKTQEVLMLSLTPKIYAWSYFYRFISPKPIFYSLNSVILQFLWRWACRRHNNKSKKWVKTRYFFQFNDKMWIFGNRMGENLIPKTFSNHKKRPASSTFYVYLPLYSQLGTLLKEPYSKNRH